MVVRIAGSRRSVPKEIEVRRVPVDADGRVETNVLRGCVDSETMLAQNETGTGNAGPRGPSRGARARRVGSHGCGRGGWQDPGARDGPVCRFARRERRAREATDRQGMLVSDRTRITRIRYSEMRFLSAQSLVRCSKWPDQSNGRSCRSSCSCSSTSSRNSSSIAARSAASESGKIRTVESLSHHDGDEGLSQMR